MSSVAFEENVRSLTRSPIRGSWESAATDARLSPGNDISAPRAGSPEEERLDPDAYNLRLKSGYYIPNPHRAPHAVNMDDPANEEEQEKKKRREAQRLSNLAQSITLANGIVLSQVEVLRHFDIIDRQVEEKKEAIKEDMAPVHKVAIGADGRPIQTKEELDAWLKTQTQPYRPGYWISQEQVTGSDAFGNPFDGRQAFDRRMAEAELDGIGKTVSDARKKLESGELTLEELPDDVRALVEQANSGDIVTSEPAALNPKGYAIVDPRAIMVESMVKGDGPAPDPLFTSGQPKTFEDILNRNNDASAPPSILRMEQPAMRMGAPAPAF